MNKVNLNSCTEKDLQQIIHIGQSRAVQAVKLRPFTKVEDLTLIKGIAVNRLTDILQQGIATVESIEPALTYKGYTGGGPSYFIFNKNIIKGIQTGDLLYTFFEIGKKRYASTSTEITDSEEYFIQKGINNDFPKKTGFDDGEAVQYAIFRDGKYYLLETNTDWAFTQAAVTNEVIEVHNNPFYSIEPVWPEGDINGEYVFQIPQAKIKLPVRKMSTLGEILNLNYQKWNVTPIFYDKIWIEVIDVTLNVKGKPESYRLSTRGSVTQSTYRVTQNDFDRGHISFMIAIKPLRDAVIDTAGTFRVLKIEFV
jgi:hypothetical protein